MANIKMNGYEIEDTTTHTFTFRTSNDAQDEICAARAVMELAQAFEVYYNNPIRIEKNFLARENKWSIIVKGTYTEIGLFKEEARNVVKEWRV